MFCKYCGEKIADTSAFCPACGKKLTRDEVQEQELRPSSPAPLALMLLLSCWPTVYDWGRVLLFGDHIQIDILISTLMLAAGLILFGSLVSRERIHPRDYRFSDLFPLLCVCVAVPWLTEQCAELLIYPAYGVYTCYGLTYWLHIAVPAIQIPAFWLLLGISALGLARREDFKPTKKHQLILLAGALLAAALGFVFAVPLFASIGLPAESIEAATAATRVWCILCWLWPLFVLKVFRFLGEGKIGIGGAMASLLGMQVGEVLLLPVLVYSLDLGIPGAALSKGLAPLMGLVILLIVHRLPKKVH